MTLRTLSATLALLIAPWPLSYAYECAPVSLEVGWRCDKLTLTAGGESSSASQLSEQAWKDVYSATAAIQISKYTDYNCYWKGKFLYGQSYRANASIDLQSSSCGDIHFKRSPSGQIYDGLAAFGVPIWFNGCHDTCITPLVGYSYTRLHLKSKLHDNIGSDSSTKLLATTTTVLQSPFGGIEWHLPFCESWQFSGSYSYFWKARVHAKNHYQFDELYHCLESGDGRGNGVEVALSYRFCDVWEAYLRGQYVRWEASHGHGYSKLIAHPQVIKNKNNLQKAEWCYWDLNLGVVMLY